MTEEIPEYSSHREQVAKVEGVIERTGIIETALETAFEMHVFYREVPFINFGNVTAEELALAFINFPVIIKPLITCVNVAGRAIDRDLGMSIDTYKGNLKPEQASILAGYIKPMLPNELAIPAISELDKWFFVDKEVRKNKGNWEKIVLDSLNSHSNLQFKKRKFLVEGKEYELDAAAPTVGDILVGIDVKRMEAKRDIHKRADEIINKASKFKRVFPASKFYAYIYFPFPAEHLSVQMRLSDPNIDGIYFAAESVSSVVQQAMFILGDASLLSSSEEGE
ncbi:hypothetical protein [Paenibacillus graminis]|uniref:hypothetical protein n=1 Tax=Paenibacillus graminis TaxID=189425 RepID=UPI002DBE2FB3|nr:hypothetical protein [Paenibacillus graminis]MEC0169123.1 hypothetical protein [Paenibacillus graminis]